MLRQSFIGAMTCVLVACGGQSFDETGAGSETANADCPPVQKGNGIAVSSRFNYDDLLESNRWRDTLYARDCAGALGALIPDLPSGYGVIPTVRPYVMNEQQVYLAYAPLPDPLYIDEVPNIPLDIKRMDFEIVQFSADEMSKLKAWMAQNPSDFFSGQVGSREVYLIGGFAATRPGKGDRLSTALHLLLENNTVVRISHKSLFTQTPGLVVSPIVESFVQDISARATRAGY